MGFPIYISGHWNNPQFAGAGAYNGRWLITVPVNGRITKIWRCNTTAPDADQGFFIEKATPEQWQDGGNTDCGTMGQTADATYVTDNIWVLDKNNSFQAGETVGINSGGGGSAGGPTSVIVEITPV